MPQLNEGLTVSDFEVIRQMQASLHQEETAASEAKLISDGTWVTRLASYEPIAMEKLPHAGVAGYRLCFNVEADDTVKRTWIDVYFTPVTNAKGLVLKSKLGAQLATVLGMNEGDTFVTLLERAKSTPIMQRITKEAAKNGYKPRNTTWQISAVKEG